MKHAELHSLVHNAADSLGSGIGILIGVYEDLDVYGEAIRSPNGEIVVDFLTGEVIEGEPSPNLANAVMRYRDALSKLCADAGGSLTDLHEATARFWSDKIKRRIDVTIEDRAGHRSTKQYAGVPAQRLKVMDDLGRLRPKPALRH